VTSGTGQRGSGITDRRSEARAVIERALTGAKTPCITSSFQAECVVLMHMLREVRPAIPVLFLDTYHHFPQTIAYRDDLTTRWDLNLVMLRATTPRVGLWQESTDACCQRHKVEPLFSALEGYDAWFTALRRDQSPSRANLQDVEPFKLPGKTIARVAPLAGWTARDVWAYAKDHDIPLLPLYELGYTSIGCEPCTRAVLPGQHERAGRWWWEDATLKECGLHSSNTRKAP